MQGELDMVAENNLEALDTENPETANGYTDNEPAVIYEKKVDDLGRAYATGKKKKCCCKGVDQARQW